MLFYRKKDEEVEFECHRCDQAENITTKTYIYDIIKNYRNVIAIAIIILDDIQDEAFETSHLNISLSFDDRNKYIGSNLIGFVKHII